MQHFINYNGEIYSYVFKNHIFDLYKNNNLLFSVNCDFKEVSLPVSPLYYDNKIFLTDYDYGLEIIDDKNKYFIKIKAIYSIKIIGEYLLAFTRKKMHKIDFKNGVIVESINVSENFVFCNNKEYALFYRISRNESFLYDISARKTYNLGKIFKKDISIIKLLSSGKKLYFLNFTGARENQNVGFIVFDLIENKYYEECYGQFSATGYEYLKYIDFPLNESISIKYDNYGEMMCSIIEKYGIYLGFYLASEEKMKCLEGTIYNKLYMCFNGYKELMYKYGKINSENDLIELNKELIMLADQIK